MELQKSTYRIVGLWNLLAGASQLDQGVEQPLLFVGQRGERGRLQQLLELKRQQVLAATFAGFAALGAVTEQR